MKIGIIGTGIIASYMVQGFFASGFKGQFILSPRNREKAAALKEQFPDNVTIAENNQQVLDLSQIVILSVLPQTAESILAPLSFREDLKVINVIPILGLEKIERIIGKTQILVDVLPLPFIAQNMGPIVLYPQQKEIEQLLAPLGDLIVAKTQREMNTLRSVTALMSPYYQLIRHVVDWCGTKGVEEKEAKEYTTSFFKALSVMASQTPEGKLEELAEEMTPGGLNWQTTEFLKESSAFTLWQKALNPIFDRVTKDIPEKKD